MPDFAVVTAFKATDKMSPVFSKIEGRIRKMTGGLERMVGLGKGSMLRDLMPAAGVTGFIMMGNAVKEAAKQADALKTSFASVFQGDAANQMSFVRKEANRLGLDFVMAADAYKGIAAAAKGTAISNRDVQNTFLGVSEAATALQLTSEQSQGALLAISQIISKGKVSMEELRGQLGERIPGAMQIAARSMGVTTAELEKLVARGIPAEKFIPRFAAQMRKEFGPAAVDASKKFAASEQRFKNLMFTMKASVGNVLLPVLNDAMMVLTPFIAAFAEWMDKNQEMVTSIVGVAVPAIGILAGSYLAAKAALMGIAIWQGIVTGVGWIQYLMQMLPLMRSVIATHGLFNFLLGGTATAQALVAAKTKIATAAQWLWNIALTANPIGLIIVGVAALIAIGVLLYKNWDLVKEKFLSAVSWMWDGIKMIGRGFMTCMMFPINLILTGVSKLFQLASKLPGVGGKFASAAQAVSDFQAKANSTLGSTNLLAPNGAREAGRSGVDFQGQLNIAGAPPGSTVTSKTRGAPPINMNLVGAQ